MTQLMSIAEFRDAAKNGARPDGAVFRLAPSDAEIQVNDDTRVVTFVFSDETIDRMGDKIIQSGWDLEDFNRNPVALWSHDSSMPPIGRASNVGVKNNKLVGDIEFADAETYAFADTIYRLVKGRFVRACSVGFLPVEYKFVESKDRPWGVDFLKQSLLEISPCPVPANPNALQEAKRMGIDTSPLREWAEKLLDMKNSVLIPRDVLEETFKAAKTPKTLRQKYLAPVKSAEELAAEAAADEAAKIAAAKAASDTDTPTDDDESKMPAGNCGLSKESECGMKDPQMCSIHYTPPEVKTHKAGRRISAATKALVDAATEHLNAMGGYHTKAMDCMKAILDSADEDGAHEPDGDHDKDLEKARVARLKAAKKIRQTVGIAAE